MIDTQTIGKEQKGQPMLEGLEKEIISIIERRQNGYIEIKNMVLDKDNPFYKDYDGKDSVIEYCNSSIKNLENIKIEIKNYLEGVMNGFG